MADKLASHLIEKNGWTNKIISSIDWEAHRTLVKSTSLVQRVTLLKFVHGWLATQKNDISGRGLIVVQNVSSVRMRRIVYIFLNVPLVNFRRGENWR